MAAGFSPRARRRKMARCSRRTSDSLYITIAALGALRSDQAERFPGAQRRGRNSDAARHFADAQGRCRSARFGDLLDELFLLDTGADLP